MVYRTNNIILNQYLFYKTSVTLPNNSDLTYVPEPCLGPSDGFLTLPFHQSARCQFHQRFTYSFYARRSQKCQMTLLIWLPFFAHSGSTYVKAVCRTLMKLSPGACFKSYQNSLNIFARSLDLNYCPEKWPYLQHTSLCSNTCSAITDHIR